MPNNTYIFLLYTRHWKYNFLNELVESILIIRFQIETWLLIIFLIRTCIIFKNIEKKNFWCLDICIVLNVVFSHSYIYINYILITNWERVLEREKIAITRLDKWKLWRLLMSLCEASFICHGHPYTINRRPPCSTHASSGTVQSRQDVNW